VTTPPQLPNELVTAKDKCGRPAVPVGALGMVVRVHESDPPTYDVEFFDVAATSLGVHTVPRDRIEPVKARRGRSRSTYFAKR